MSDPSRRPETPRQAEDLFFENLRGLHPDAKLSDAIDRRVRDRSCGPEVEPRGQAADRTDGAATLPGRANRTARCTRGREPRRSGKK